MQHAMLTNALGYIAAGLVFATFCAKRMASLRALAIVSNVAFIGYAFLNGLWPILVLHCAMLPMNIQRYRQAARGDCSTTTDDAGTPALSRSTLFRNSIIVALGRLRSWNQRVIPAPTFDVLKRPLKGGTKVTFRPRTFKRLKAPGKQASRNMSATHKRAASILSA